MSYALTWLIAGALIVQGAADPTAPTRAERGVTARRVLPATAAPLRAKPIQSPLSTVFVRVIGDGNGSQLVEFIGSVPGTYDLRDHLELVDGRPATDLPAMPVEIVSRAHDAHANELELAPLPAVSVRTGYTRIVAISLAAWVAIPAVVLVVRRLRRRRSPEVVEPSVRVWSPIEEIDRLAREGAMRDLSVDERGHLELLVLRLLNEERHVHGEAGIEVGAMSVVRAPREHRDRGNLTLALERWLHVRDDASAAPRRRTEALRALRELTEAQTRPNSRPPSGLEAARREEDASR